MSKMLNTFYDFKLADGTTVPLTLNFYYLYQLRTKNKAMYERYNRIMVNQSKGNYDDIENVEILYTAYACAGIARPEITLMQFDEFLMLCGSNREAVGKALQALLAPKN